MIAQSYQQAYICQQLLFQQQQAVQEPSNFTHFYSPQDYSDLYIRRARGGEDAKKNKNKMQNGQQGYSYMQPQPLYNGYSTDQYFPDQQTRGRQRNNNKRQQNGTNNSQSKNNNDSNNNVRNNRRGNNNRGNNKNNNNNRKRSTSRSQKKPKQQDGYQPKKNRPRMDSEDFPVLKQKNEESGKMETVQYLQKTQPIVTPAQTAYQENRIRIDKQYSKFEIQTSFERWKVDKEMNPSLRKFLNNTRIPVIVKTPIYKLEVEQPYRKNSTSVTPLLKPMPQSSQRKASFHYKSTSPNKRVRKFSSQK